MRILNFMVLLAIGMRVLTMIVGIATYTYLDGVCDMCMAYFLSQYLERKLL